MKLGFLKQLGKKEIEERILQGLKNLNLEELSSKSYKAFVKVGDKEVPVSVAMRILLPNEYMAVHTQQACIFFKNLGFDLLVKEAGYGSQ